MRYFILSFLLFLININNGYTQGRSRLSPDIYSTQFAGSIGYVSAGIGYEIIKSRGNLNLHYGFVPESKGGDFHILTLKFIYKAWKLPVAKGVTFLPTNIGAFVSYHADGDLSSSWPSYRYEDGYYWWKTSIRFHILWEQRLSIALKHNRFSHLNLFTEFNTNDLYLVSYLQNRRSLKPGEFLKLGVGVSLQLR